MSLINLPMLRPSKKSSVAQTIILKAFGEIKGLDMVTLRFNSINLF